LKFEIDDPLMIDDWEFEIGGLKALNLQSSIIDPQSSMVHQFQIENSQCE